MNYETVPLTLRQAPKTTIFENANPIGCISENAIFVVSLVVPLCNNDNLFAKFYSGTLKIIGTMRLMSLFEIFLEHLLEFFLIYGH